MFGKIRTFWLAATLAMMASTLATTAPAVANAGTIPASATENGYLGTAYGTQVVVGSTVKSGRSAVSTLGCTSTPGVTHTNTAASIGVPGLSTGTIDTSVASAQTDTAFQSTSSSTIQNVSVLGGLVGATAVKSVSTTSRDISTGKYSTSAAGTQFVGLMVAGLPVGGTPPPNTKLTLPGVGYVELNQQTSHISSNSASLRVIGLHIVVTLSTPLAPLGTQIDVGFASSGLA
ncbi:MAG TPA: choice-of-anchor P family protein, partial [Pseudonocardiaceae bacterium]|nr:choice-of-anchor P family protein [Pseudonocardiaceae bacterium]